MRSPDRQAQYDALLRDLDSETGRALLARLHEEFGISSRFDSWTELIAFMRAGPSGTTAKDVVLESILGMIASDQHPLWRAALLVFFWPMLLKLHGQKRKYDADHEARWQNVCWVFLEAAHRFPLGRRKEGIAGWLKLKTVQLLYKHYAANVWPAQRESMSLDSDEARDAWMVTNGAGFTEVEARVDRAWLAMRAKEAAETGRITEEDFTLIYQTRVLGRSLRDFATETGDSYQRLKKRRQRAEVVLNVALKE